MKLSEVLNTAFLFLLTISGCGESKEIPTAIDQRNFEIMEAEGKKEKLKDGYVEEHWPNGNLSTAGYYKNGKANGLMKWYHEDGVQVAEGNMTDDKRNGAWKICDIHDHSACIDANFNMDIREGLWKIFHANGQLHQAQNWANDKMISKLCWNEKGEEIKCE